MLESNDVVVSAGPIVVPRRPTGKENVPPNTPSGRKRVRHRSIQRRHWVFTSYSTEAGKLFQAIEGGLGTLDESVRYIVFQKEKGAEGREHFQGYVEFRSGYRLDQVRSRIDPQGHFEARRGSADEAIAYCKKQDTRVGGPWEFGERSRGAGARSDIESFRDAIRSGSRKRSLYESHPGCMARFPRFYEGYRDVLSEQGWREVEVILLIGETGLGKTRWVYSNWNKGSFWRFPIVINTVWFDGYDGQEYALMDDFSGQLRLRVLLQILDGYIVKAPIKHGFTWYGPKHIAITSNIEPRLWYKWKGREGQYMALARRFKTVMQFVEDDVIIYPSKDYFHKEDIQIY